MSMRKLISVIVPTYNQAEYLGACLDSIMFQDYPNIELIVVADPSPDNTSEVLAEFQRSVMAECVSYASNLEEDGSVSRTYHLRYPQSGRKLVVIENKERMGHTPSYNHGFQLARGEYCTYVASDDICHPQWLSELAAPLDGDEADFVYSDTFIFADDGRILREFKFPDYDFQACFGDWYLCGVSKLYRRELHDQLGYYDDEFVANDHELYQRFALGGARFKHLPKTLYSVRTHEGRHNDVHAKESWDKLIAESSGLVGQAREAIKQGKMGAVKPHAPARDRQFKALKKLCEDRELVTCEAYTPNDFYGHATLLKQYAGLAPDTVLRTVVEHGAYYPSYAWDVDLKANLPMHLAFGENRLEMLQQRGAANPLAIGPLIHYCEPSLNPEEIKRERERMGKTLLVFPTHSTHWRKVTNNTGQFCRSVEAAAEGFDTVRLCLYWKDVLNGAAELYLNQDWEIASAGHMYDPLFCPRLKSLVLSADACMTFEWGTHIGYSVFLDRPVFTCPVEFAWCDSGAAPPPVLDGGVRTKTMDMFGQWTMEITPEQRNLVSESWGFNSVRSPEEMRELLLKAEAAWKDREQR